MGHYFDRHVEGWLKAPSEGAEPDIGMFFDSRDVTEIILEQIGGLWEISVLDGPAPTGVDGREYETKKEALADLAETAGFLAGQGFNGLIVVLYAEPRGEEIQKVVWFGY